LEEDNDRYDELGPETLDEPVDSKELKIFRERKRNKQKTEADEHLCGDRPLDEHKHTIQNY
jgi:hypothetical protein